MKQRQRWSDVATSQGMPKMWPPPEAGRDRKGGAPCFQTFGLQNPKRITVCGLKPSSLGRSVTVARGNSNRMVLFLK